jgi:hypothetical protein
MSNYFHVFPKLPYDVDGTMPNKYQTVRNIMSRVKLKNSIKEEIAAYYPYFILEGERPDILSYRYYGSVSYAYLLLLFNNIIDPQFDWPLNTVDFENYIVSKYGSVSAAHEETKFYYQIIRAEVPKTKNREKEDEVKYVVDETTYNALGITDRKKVTAYDYETQVNDNKRYIKVINKDLIEDVDHQYKKAMS